MRTLLGFALRVFIPAAPFDANFGGSFFRPTTLDKKNCPHPLRMQTINRCKHTLDYVG
jgi:hypothetical protein